MTPVAKQRVNTVSQATRMKPAASSATCAHCGMTLSLLGGSEKEGMDCGRDLGRAKNWYLTTELFAY